MAFYDFEFHFCVPPVRTHRDTSAAIAGNRRRTNFEP
jgi:hypothetical protein